MGMLGILNGNESSVNIPWNQLNEWEEIVGIVQSLEEDSFDLILALSFRNSEKRVRLCIPKESKEGLYLRRVFNEINIGDVIGVLRIGNENDSMLIRKISLNFKGG